VGSFKYQDVSTSPCESNGVGGITDHAVCNKLCLVIFLQLKIKTKFGANLVRFSTMHCIYSRLLARETRASLFVFFRRFLFGFVIVLLFNSPALAPKLKCNSSSHEAFIAITQSFDWFQFPCASSPSSVSSSCCSIPIFFFFVVRRPRTLQGSHEFSSQQ